LKIGASGTCGNEFVGIIDEVNIFRSALSAAEVAAMARRP
jgi:hypothetical protein